MKSSCRRPGTKRPFRSVTVAVTLTRSTPLRNRNSSSFCPATLELPATTTTAAATASPVQRRSMCFIGAFYLILRLLERTCQFCIAAAVDVRDHIGARAEADAITRNGARVRNADFERRLLT